MRLAWLLAALALATPAHAQRPPPASFQPAATFQPSEDNPADFPDAPGKDETLAFCGACHGMKIVAAQGMTRPQWDESLKWMVLRHNMPQLDRDDLDLILAYLERAFPPKATGGRPGWSNPFAPPK